MSDARAIDGGVIGKRLPRKEDGRLLTGRGTFVDDIVLPGMLHVAFVRSPIARGRIRSIDTSIARESAGRAGGAHRRRTSTASTSSC